MTAEQLAKLCIQVLNAQKKYFETRDRADLIASKALESKLRTAANSIIDDAYRGPAAVQEKMF